MMQDFRVTTALRGSLKCRRLRRKHGAKVIDTLVGIWGSVAVEAPSSGVLPKGTFEEIAEWADVDEEMIHALIEGGFLDELDDGRLAVHDWVTHQPYLTMPAKMAELGRRSGEARRKKAEERTAVQPPVRNEKRTGSERATNPLPPSYPQGRGRESGAASAGPGSAPRGLRGPGPASDDEDPDLADLPPEVRRAIQAREAMSHEERAADIRRRRDERRGA